ncbi:YgjP-like metallopeptidase domain-containing protein [Pontibacter sp. JAM-7]|uniref:YgjP-like metallopeptidase domain-containing protein n=1 Tax=Pontibacter sp. JAM-7 TaxID=3366581 RepID=UPI003AF6498B
MRAADPYRYIAGYPETIQSQARQLVTTDELAAWITCRYPTAHDIRSHKALYDYTQSLKNRFLKQTPPLSKVSYDDKISVLLHALGAHSRISRVQGGRYKAKQEIRIDARFKQMPEAFLKMILVHELAHIREREHNRAFYNLCCYMEPDYHQLELHLRLYMVQLETGGSLY